MEDYPKTLAEFEARFSTEEACRDYLAGLRWPKGFRCPRCGHGKAWPVGRLLYQCAGCGYQASVTAGTVFDKTRKPLTLWFRAAWWVASRRSGGSARELQKFLGIGSYQTAWVWYHKLRRSMVRPGRQRLSGIVEVAVTGREAAPASSPKTTGGAQPGVAIAVETRGKRGIGRIRLRRVADPSRAGLEAFVKSAVEPGSTVRTSAHGGFEALEALGYAHRVAGAGGTGPLDVAATRRAARVAALLEGWLLEAHQGAVRPEHLDAYLDEFTFRFNRRTAGSRGRLFHRLLRQAVLAAPAPYRDMVRRDRTRTREPLRPGDGKPEKTG
jgi:transposase-like protein